jgi:TRAP-type C4-dicarboxylate transport system substrate-binding protein
MARSVRPVVLLALTAVLADCAAPGSYKAGPQARHPVVLTMASFLGDSSEFPGFAGEVRRLSAGTMRIDIRSGWRFGQVTYETGLIGDVRAGKADLGVVSSRVWDSVGVNSFRALGAPLLISSYALQDRVLRSPMIGQMLQGLRPLGLVGIGVLPGPLRRPLGITRPLLKPADYARLKIGVPQSRVDAATMRALGATPVGFPDVAPGAAVRGLDGLEQQISSIQGNEYDMAGKYLTANVNLWPRPIVLFANGQAWAALTPAQRRILRQAVTDYQAAETNVVHVSERNDTATLCRRGLLRFLTASTADLAALRRAVRPVYAQLERDPQTRRYIRQIEAMRKGLSPEPAPRCAPTAPVAGTPGPLDGVWQYTSTAADLKAVGTPEADIIPESYGTFTIVIDRGRFAYTQENRQACIWGYGTFAVKGHEFEQLYTADGGGIAPDGAVNRRGEFFTFRWSLYRGVLTLYPAKGKGAVSPQPSMAKPWLRISTTPSARFLSRRCLPPSGALPP